MTLMRDWTGLGERVQPMGSTDPEADSRPTCGLDEPSTIVWNRASHSSFHLPVP